MSKAIEKLETRAIMRYGFESKKTIRLFKATEMLRKVLTITE